MKIRTKMLVLSIFTLLISTITGFALAQSAVVGVPKGAIFEYDYNLQLSSTDPSAQTLSHYLELNKTQAMQLKIIDISGTKISIEKTTIFKNGSQAKTTGYIDINTGNLQLNFGSLIVGANLNVQDKLYPSGGNALINDTSMRTYPSGQRETNHYISETTDENYYEKVEICFDKAMGVAVSYYYESRETVDGYTTTIKETLNSTNSAVWAVALPSPSVPEFSFLVVPVVLAAASAVLLIGKKAKSLPVKL